LDKSGKSSNFDEIQKLLTSEQKIGLLSESGMPGIADPGSEIVTIAHHLGVKVVPLVGPSSLFLALAASGLNGQNFKFEGYLPIKDGELKVRLKQITNAIQQNKTTYIFIETPYRNDRILEYLIKEIPKHLRLCVAKDITGQLESIQTKTIKEWRANKITIGKTPTIFLLGH